MANAKGKLVVFFWISLGALAQSPAPSVTISGTVQDQTGGTLVGAIVSLHRPEDRQDQAAASDSTGSFRFAVAAARTYVLRIDQPGFKPFQQTVRVGSRSPASLRVVLTLASRREEVTVRGETNAVNTEAAENRDAVIVTQKTMQQLPVFDLDYLAMMSRFLSQGDIATGGVTLVVDGMEANGVGVSPSAIKEVKINQDPYSPEFSRPGRGQIQISTEGGTPQYHGTFNYLFRDSLLNARPTFAAVKPAEQRRMYEGAVTGPLQWWPKTYFLLSLQQDEEDLASVVFAQGLQGAIRENVPSPIRHWFGSARISHDYPGGSYYWLSYSYEDRSSKNQGLGGTVLPSAATNSQFLEHEITLNHKYVLSKKWLNEFRGYVGHYRSPTTSLSKDPKTVVLDAFTGGGAQADQKRTEWHFGMADTMSWSSGRHLVKYGFTIPDWSRRAMDDFTNSGGTYSFSTLQDYASNKPYSLLLQRGEGRVVFVEKTLGAFVQDQIQLTPSLTLAYGVRYYWQNNFNDRSRNVAPRASYAWAPGKSRKTVLRGGAGIFYDRTGPGPVWDLLRFDGQHLLRFLVDNPPFPDPLVSGSLPPAAPGVVRLDPLVKIPYQLQYSTGVEQQIGKSMTLAASYVGNVFVSSFRSRDINAPLAPLYLARPSPAFGQIREIESAGRGLSNALEITLRGNVKRFLGMAQYTFSKAMNNTGGITWFPANSNTLAGEWARADFDQRHRLHFMGAVNSGLWLNLGIALQVASGKPYSETTGQDANNDGLALDRPTGIARNSLEGPALAQLDLRWSKDFLLSPKRKDKGPIATMSLDAFNAFNHSNYISYVGTLGSPFFGKAVAANPNRRIQLSFRFRF